MVIDLVIQYCGNFAKPTENVSGDAECMRVLVRKNGKHEVIFEGPEFSEEKFQQRLASENALYAARIGDSI